MNRRYLLKTLLYSTGALLARPGSSFAQTTGDTVALIAALEHRHGGRLGVATLDTATGMRSAYRGNERFLICSTFKLLLTAAVLKRVDNNEEQLDRRITFDRSLILAWAPVTGLNVGSPGMSIQELCEATMIMSDNTAANLLLETLGGPAAVTAYARSLGDTKTRLDHIEPLDGSQQGDEDTTTPQSMLENMQKIMLGKTLSEESRTRLINWFAMNQTGSQTLKAGLSSDWLIGDKTGAANNTNNDIALITPPGRQPILVAAYYTNDGINSNARKAVLAKVGKIVVKL
ncbi:class A beta-lactamase [Paenalcaligenes niemegkensis]|uniref:class A beta-lactamase n=1 Tax=Paenalcaligenes niemegkensis TaxID=2895469 RepID=UPI001EE7E040|nr:class A beta-lactamase [Paenalcaligenes niemegkensis]MCQ9616410.1 class A beta-lactamase [Paenalcaligenes niemegkensis]